MSQIMLHYAGHRAPLSLHLLLDLLFAQQELGLPW